MINATKATMLDFKASPTVFLAAAGNKTSRHAARVTHACSGLPGLYLVSEIVSSPKELGSNSGNSLSMILSLYAPPLNFAQEISTQEMGMLLFGSSWKSQPVYGLRERKGVLTSTELHPTSSCRCCSRVCNTIPVSQESSSSFTLATVSQSSVLSRQR
jgi:hypothetical protein